MIPHLKEFESYWRWRHQRDLKASREKSHDYEPRPRFGAPRRDIPAAFSAHVEGFDDVPYDDVEREALQWKEPEE